MDILIFSISLIASFIFSLGGVGAAIILIPILVSFGMPINGNNLHTHSTVLPARSVVRWLWLNIQLKRTENTFVKIVQRYNNYKEAAMFSIVQNFK